jgi:hypothetical protein
MRHAIAAATAETSIVINTVDGGGCGGGVVTETISETRARVVAGPPQYRCP